MDVVVFYLVGVRGGGGGGGGGKSLHVGKATP